MGQQMLRLSAACALLLLAGCAGVKVSAGPLALEATTGMVGASVNLSKDGKTLGGIAPYISLSELGGLFSGFVGATQPTP